VAALDDLVQHCLAKDPRDRLASADDLRSRLIPRLRVLQSSVELL
jgi:hypothetical protein